MIANSLQAVVTQALLPTADGAGRVAALEILLPDDAVRNLIRQAKIEQIYSVMQTGTARGMQTMEQALADLVLRGVVTSTRRSSRSSRPEQLLGILERAGFDVAGARRRPKRPIAARPHCDGGELSMSDSIWKKEISFKRRGRPKPSPMGSSCRSSRS